MIALSIALVPLLQVLKARTTRLGESYFLLPVFTRDYAVDKYEAISRSQYALTVNTSRRLLLFPFDYVPPQNVKLPPWDPYLDAWKVRRHLSEESLLFVKINVANVSYFLDLDFRGQLTWINCKWKPKDKRSTWTKFTDKFKANQLHVSRYSFLTTGRLLFRLRAFLSRSSLESSFRRVVLKQTFVNRSSANGIAFNFCNVLQCRRTLHYPNQVSIYVLT